MVGVAVQINSFQWEPQPGWVECTLIDAGSREWHLGMKTAYLSCGQLSESSAFPQLGVIPCLVVARRHDERGRAIVDIDTDLPSGGVESSEGETKFTVFAAQLEEVA
jgi:hypothetical protein